MTPHPGNVPPKAGGWCTWAAQLRQVLVELRPRQCVEIGTWLGESALVIGKAIQPWGGRLTCVDPWAPTGWDADNAEIQAQLPTVYAHFCANVWAAGLQDVITPIVGYSVEAARTHPPADFVFIDGAHDTESVTADIRAWWPLVSPGGVMCGDDYTHPPVRAAWDTWDPGRQFRRQAHLGFIAVLKLP